MPNKILYIATVDSHFEKFHLPYFKWFQDQGWEVHVAAAGNLSLPYVNQKYTIAIDRSPLRRKNAQAYRELKEIMNSNQYSIIHCHTPMGGVLARLAAVQARKQGTRVFYTAHGFHFCKGAPLLNWLAYYPIERLLARYTDCLITINEEDYSLAKAHRFPAGHIEHVYGVGVDIDQYKPMSQEKKRVVRKSLGFCESDFLMVYAAEFNKNKNQQLLINALALLKDEIPNAKLLLAGNGPLEAECRRLATELGVIDQVHFLGYRHDLKDWLPACDLAVASSLREGLPINIVEAMACKLPIVASHNRGHSELIENNVNGYIVPASSPRQMSERIVLLYHAALLQEVMGRNNRQKTFLYSLAQVEKQLATLYLKYGMEVWNDTEGQYRRTHL